MKIIIMGDIHADFGSVNQFLNKQKPDIVLQCGDFGWWPHRHGTEKITRNRRFDQYSIKPQSTKIYWCDGNHENHDDLQERMKAAPGQPLEIPVPGCFYMPRGSVLTLPDGRNVLFFGGAMSTDRDGRTEGDDWWAKEVPTVEDLDHARAQVAAHGGRVDIVISHTGPTRFLRQLPAKEINPARLMDPTVALLDAVLEEFQPRQWFFGHFHLHAKGVDQGCAWQCLSGEGLGGTWWVELSS
ncbi:Icc-related predicted phosphoesterase [Desulfomicrobium macestii]|uniref:Icc-related predicted phosphoesterase n=1 Tax=Desulfomicrobium macestii TaxID=90731 RepID=A0ABR9H8K7_9BACT|nr:metallophosphoesterase [Desulfomicrobium macestii]MBE1427030.1 Icc-related predicted phosphoesterase [Desulfomicrobium macestii]